MRGRFREEAAVGGLARLGGREDELCVLMSRREQVVDAEGQ